MRRALVLTAATVASALLVVGLACTSTDNIAKTVLNDAGHCVIGDGGDGGETCAHGEFCSSIMCGSNDGICEHIDSDGCAATSYECGCDRITYYNRCVRQEAHEALAGGGFCVGQMGQFPMPCASADMCPSKNAACAAIFPFSLPDYEGGPATLFLESACSNPARNFPGSCWALPDAPDAGPAPGSQPLEDLCARTCTDDLHALRRGGMYFFCSDASLPH